MMHSSVGDVATPKATGAPTITFYIPADLWPEDISSETGYFWSANRSGKWNWTIQTHEHLQAHGVASRVAKQMPEEGVIVAHREVLPDDFVPGPRQLVVCIQADHGRHPHAQVHLMQNRWGLEASQRSLRERIDRLVFPSIEPSAFIRYWPQPELIPRDDNRGDRFVNVAYMGRAKNLAPELQDDAWLARMDALGLSWHIIEERDRWKDYSKLDAVIAVRDFEGAPHLHKPATKLYNAWHAGTPAVLGPDSAFRSERTSDLDYLEVTSLDDVEQALVRLRDNVELRRAMIEQGRRRAQETTVPALVDAWRSFFEDVAFPYYRTWRSAGLRRRLFQTIRRIGAS